MKVCLLTLFVGSAFICQETLAASCFSCCTTPSDVLFCTFSEDGKNCSGGCECCPTESQIGQSPDGHYFCCQGEKPQVTPLLNKAGYSMCCATGQTAYQTSADNSECCDGAVLEVLGRSGIYHCCEKGQTAYWNGSSVACCPTANALVTNYKNGVGEAGYACCQVKEDPLVKVEIISGLEQRQTSSGYHVIGATNGSCCWVYTNNTQTIGDSWVSSSTSSVSIRQNGGEYYCAGEGQGTSISSNAYFYYESDSRYCQDIRYGDTPNPQCYCSSSGDPKNGSSC